MSRQCTNLKEDRRRGKQAELDFIRLCNRFGKASHGFQIGRGQSATIRIGGQQVIAPDVCVWSAKRGASLHEVKRKYPTADGMFGLEEYRFDALKTLDALASVWYTVLLHADSDKARHNLEEVSISSGRRYTPGMWLTASVSSLRKPSKERTGYSWRGGEKTKCNIYYWHISRFEIIHSGYIKNKATSDD